MSWWKINSSDGFAAVFGGILTVAVSIALFATTVQSPVAQAQAPYDINAMGRECTEKIGVIKPFSCLDGEIIPITVNGRVVQPGEPPPPACDRPSFLAPAYCKPFARIGRLPSLGPDGQPDADVQTNFICRRYNNVTDPSNPEFKDVAIIQHRKSTGETCFFQHLEQVQSNFMNATRVPPPNETVSQTPTGNPTARTFWLDPAATAGINCAKCHDAGPFIHSPHVDQVKVNGETIVYPFPRLQDGEKNNYRYVGAAFNFWGVPEFIRPTNNKCTECHVLGTQTSSSEYTKFSVGKADPLFITAMYKAYPHSHWMPPDQAAEMDKPMFDSIYEQSILKILSCSSAGTMQSAPDCNRSRFGPN